jgi:hypothetical protein
MTNLQEKAMRMALEDICGAKLCEINSMSSRAEMLRLMDKAAEALRQALAQPEQEPVGWADRFEFDKKGHDFWCNRQKPAKGGIPLYTAPPKREWVGLTDEEKNFLMETWIGFRNIEKVIETTDELLRRRTHERA